MAAIAKAFIFVSSLSVALCASLASLSCPNQEVLAPCSCTRAAYGMQVVCANFNISTHLIRTLHILKDYKVHTILLHGLMIDETLPSDLFDGMNVKEIRVEKSNLKFPKPAFSGLDSSLFVLNVAQRSVIVSDNRFSLAKLTSLNELNVQSNQLKQVDDTWLNEKLPNVHKVVLDSNEIAVIGPSAFSSLRALIEVSLADNRIKVVERSMFPRPAFKLQVIDLSYNEVRELPGDFFADMNQLRKVKLSGNELKTLSEFTWQPVWEQLTQILLYENQLQCDDNMKWIKDYRYKESDQLLGTCLLPRNMNGRNIRDIYNT